MSCSACPSSIGPMPLGQAEGQQPTQAGPKVSRGLNNPHQSQWEPNRASDPLQDVLGVALCGAFRGRNPGGCCFAEFRASLGLFPGPGRPGIARVDGERSACPTPPRRSSKAGCSLSSWTPTDGQTHNRPRLGRVPAGPKGPALPTLTAACAWQAARVRSRGA